MTYINRNRSVYKPAKEIEKTNLDQIAKALADGIREGLCSHKPWFFAELLRIIAEGNPVSSEQIAAILHIPREDVMAALRQMPNVEFDNEDNIVGSGLTLTPTPHRFQVGGHELFTWCALDTLFFPEILNQPACVESPCPVTGVKVKLKVTLEGIELLEPASAVVSIVIPEASDACCDVRGAFCDEVHFFSSSDAALTWIKGHQGAIILTVKDAYQMGRILTKHLFRASSDVSEEQCITRA